MLLATLSHEFVAQICWIRRRQEGDLCAPWLLKQEENEIWLKDQEQWKLPSQPMQAGEQGPLWGWPSTRHRWGRRQARRKCRSTDRTPGCDMIYVSTSDGQPILKCSLAKGKFQLLSVSLHIQLCFSISAGAVYFLWECWSTWRGWKVLPWLAYSTFHLAICRQFFIPVGLLAVATNQDRLW